MGCDHMYNKALFSGCRLCRAISSPYTLVCPMSGVFIRSSEKKEKEKIPEYQSQPRGPELLGPPNYKATTRKKREKKKNWKKNGKMSLARENKGGKRDKL